MANASAHLLVFFFYLWAYWAGQRHLLQYQLGTVDGGLHLLRLHGEAAVGVALHMQARSAADGGQWWWPLLPFREVISITISQSFLYVQLLLFLIQCANMAVPCALKLLRSFRYHRFGSSGSHSAHR